LVGAAVVDVELLDGDLAAAGDLATLVLLTGLRMRAAAVVQVHDSPVGRGPLVGADAELLAQRARELGEEAAAAAVRRHGAAATPLGGLAGAELALEPALGGLGAPLRGQHARPAQAELPQCDPIDVFVAGGLVALLEPLV